MRTDRRPLLGNAIVLLSIFYVPMWLTDLAPLAAILFWPWVILEVFLGVLYLTQRPGF